MNKKTIHDKGLILRQIFFMVLDVGAVIASAIAALLLRFNLSFKEIQAPYLENAWQLMLPNVLATLVIFWFFRLYHSVWRYVGMYELQQIVLASVTSTLVQLAASAIARVYMPCS